MNRRFFTPERLLAVCLLIPLAAHVYNGSFTRLMADDYCTVNVALDNGVLQAPLIWYNTWSGLFTNFVLKSAIAPLGPGFSATLPALIILACLAAAIWALYPITSLLRRPGWMAVLFGVLIVYATIQSTPNVGQSIYWTGGSIPYTLPVAAMLFYAGFFVRAAQRNRVTPGTVLIAAAVPFLAGGLSETYGLMQIAALGLASLVCYAILPAQRRKTALTLLLISLTAAVIALALVVVAPGNAVRQSRFGTRTSLPDLITLTLYTAITYPAIMLGVFAPVALLTAMIFAAALAHRNRLPEIVRWLTPRRVRRLILFSGAACVLLTTSALVPALYAVGEAPPGRVYVIPNFILVCTAVLWGSLMGFTIRSVPRTAAALTVALALIIGPAAAVWQTLSPAPQYRAYAAEWDRNDAEIRRIAGDGVAQVRIDKTHVTMDELIGLEPLGSDPTRGHNQCAADYYGVETLIVEASPASAFSP